MQRIRIRYADEHGRTREELLETKSLDNLRRVFNEKGYYILSEKIENDSFSERIRQVFSTSHVSVKELNEFTKLIRTLIKSGMPVTDAIEILLDGAQENSLNLALRQVHSDIREGVSLSKALSRHPDVFPDIYIKTIIAGEKSGALENILKRLVEYFTRSLAIRRKVVAALIYPSILLVVSCLAVTYMIVAVVPEFANLFKSLEVPLPMITSLLLSASELIGEWFWIILFVCVLLFTGFISIAKTREGRKSIDKLKLNLPLIKTLELNFAYSQFARTMATMVEGGIPILDSLGVVIDSMENKVIADRFAGLPELLKTGTGFADSLKKIQGSPQIMVRVIHVGEESGNLGEMLENIADHYDQEISELTDTITSLIEPVLFLVMALVVGTLVVALLYPVLTAASHIN